MRQRYTPMREIRSGALLGMNMPGNGKRFGRVCDAFRRDAAYWGDRHEWYIVAAQHRDSDSIDRSNFAVLSQMLGAESDAVAVERASHWAVGWIEYLIVEPSNRTALRAAIYSHCAIEDYPILDESHHSELECEEAYEYAKSELSQFGDHWYDVWAAKSDRYGSCDDENARAVEEARTDLEALAPLYESHATCAIDPAQGKFWPEAPHS